MAAEIKDIAGPELRARLEAIGLVNDLMRWLLDDAHHAASAELNDFPQLRHDGVATGDVLLVAVENLYRSLSKGDGIDKLLESSDDRIVATMRSWVRQRIRWALLDAVRDRPPQPVLKGLAAPEDSSGGGGGDLADTTSGPSSKAQRAEFRDRLNEELKKLPRLERWVFRLHKIHDHTQEETADALEITRDKMRDLFQSAARKLAAALKGHIPGPTG